MTIRVMNKVKYYLDILCGEGKAHYVHTEAGDFASKDPADIVRNYIENHVVDIDGKLYPTKHKLLSKRQITV